MSQAPLSQPIRSGFGHAPRLMHAAGSSCRAASHSWDVVRDAIRIMSTLRNETSVVTDCRADLRGATAVCNADPGQASSVICFIETLIDSAASGPSVIRAPSSKDKDVDVS